MARRLCRIAIALLIAPAALGPGLEAVATPLGLPPVPGVSDDLRNGERVALGRKLFFDTRLSRDGTLSCAGCHDPARAFAGSRAATDHRPATARDIPTLLNVAYAKSLFRDGRATSLEAQVAGPLFAPDEMDNGSAEDLVARLAGLEDYRAPFRRAYGGGPTLERIAGALAAWERTLVSGNSLFDRWFYGGEADAVGEPAKRGYVLFIGRAGCAACHRIGERHALFTDDGFHFIGTGYRTAARRASAGPMILRVLAGDGTGSGDRPPRLDIGRQAVTGDPADQWRYRTPSLRNVALTAPYMHDGSFATLEEVVNYYNYTGVWHSRLDARIRPLGLTAADVAALVAFLESLTGDNAGEFGSEAP